jgi:hypothetical protein
MTNREWLTIAEKSKKGQSDKRMQRWQYLQCKKQQERQQEMQLFDHFYKLCKGYYV